MNFVKSSLKSPAFYILAIMFTLMLGSVWNDSATMDELAHIPAGFAYITQFDGRLNPEHPPLLKILSALSGEIFARPKFPADTLYWRDYINGQWDQGRAFLYESGNNADRIIFWSRIPFILLTLLFGILLWRWTYKRFGPLTALFILLLFAFSPTILAHARYVTTDLGAAFGFFIGFIVFIKFLETPSWKYVTLAGVVFGVAELLKFSLILLIPLYGVLILAWVLTRPHLHLHERISDFFILAGKTIAMGIIGIFVIWIAYIPLVIHYPEEKQYQDAKSILASYPWRPLAEFNLTLIQNPITRPLGQYVLGLLMVFQRAGGGNTGYFLGEVSAAGSRSYFPLLYLLKEPLPLHILTLLAFWVGFSHLRRGESKDLLCNNFRSESSEFRDKIVEQTLRPIGTDKPKSFETILAEIMNLQQISYCAVGLNMRNLRIRLAEWIHNHFVEFSALSFVALYWTSSVMSPLNIGIRHVLPTFPFIYMLVSKKLAEWVEMHIVANPKNMAMTIVELLRRLIFSLPKYGILAALMLWFVFGTIAAYPHFLSFYNELAGGTRNGYKIAVDSNYDWGQDLLRLRDYVQTNGIETIAIDYFGGGNPEYYFGDKFIPWQSSKGPAHGYFAISATFLQGAFGTPAPGFHRASEDSYEWLKQYEPIGRIGQSIFIYKLP